MIMKLSSITFSVKILKFPVFSEELKDLDKEIYGENDENDENLEELEQELRNLEENQKKTKKNVKKNSEKEAKIHEKPPLPSLF